MTPRLRLVWCNPGVKERDWLLFLLSGFDLDEVNEPNWETEPQPYSLYVLDSNRTPVTALSDAFMERIPACRPIGLVHLADEWFRGDYARYSSFDFVLRTYHTRKLQAPGILTVPLGYPNGTSSPISVRRASERGCVWSFVGEPGSSRPELLAVFSAITGGRALSYSTKRKQRQPLSRSQFGELLGDSVFCPAPMGTVMLESWRLYEALEAGCIPIVERRPTLDYFGELYGRHPIPTFTTWTAARRFVERKMDQPEALDELQARIRAWWAECKQLARSRVAQLIDEGCAGNYREALAKWRFEPLLGQKAFQYSELLQHQTPYTVARRIKRILSEGARRAAR